MTTVRRALEPHPSLSGYAVRSINIAATRTASRLTLEYVLEGRLGELRIPPKGQPTRADELWRHTCFEAFVRPPGDAAYWEFNLAPSTQWQIYGFKSYRERGADPKSAAPKITVSQGAQRLTVTAALDLSQLKGSWLLAISAVVEDTRGGRGYWALRHPDGQPDFHHARGFALTLDPP